ncbi:type III effector [Shigella flexneri]|nr:type III effector [Escherichia coli]
MLPTNNLSANLYSWMYVSGNGQPSVPEAVSELNHNHLLTPELQTKLDVMFAAYSNARNNDERDDIYPELRDFISGLMDKRESVFEVLNVGTDEVKGVLREGMTTEDRDEYIRGLFFVYSLKVQIGEFRADKGYEKSKVDALLSPHHSSELYGDLKAMNTLVQGRDQDLPLQEHIFVPDLTYNKGSLQF